MIFDSFFEKIEHEFTHQNMHLLIRKDASLGYIKTAVSYDKVKLILWGKSKGYSGQVIAKTIPNWYLQW
jgi:hypothetical protein